MTILKIELHNYTMFGINNIINLIYKPNTGINIILGGNGAGKSKLLLELTPLPINKKHYKEGYKLIHIEHKDSSYVLYSGNDKQSFIKDKEELNTNGLITTQSKLVQEHFSIDNDIRELNLGNVSSRFTSVSLAHRKKWFTRISTTDYKFAIALYNNLRTTARDLRGSVKLLNSKNIEVDDNILLGMQKDLKTLRIYRDKIIVMTDRGIEDTFEPEFEYLDKVDVLINNLYAMTETSYTEDELKVMISNLKKELESALIRIGELEVHNVDTLDYTNNKIVVLEEEIQDLENNTHLVIRDNIFKHMHDIRTDLLTLFDKITHTYEEYEIVLNKYNVAKQKEASCITLNTLLQNTKDKYDEAGDTQNVECPNCNTSFKVGYDQNEYDALCKNMHDNDTTLDKVLKDLETLAIELTKAKLSISAIEHIKKLISTIHSEEVKDILYSCIGEVYAMEINTLYTSIDNSLKIYNMNITLSELQEKLKTQELLNNEDVKRTSIEKAKLNDVIDKLHKDITVLEAEFINTTKFNKQRVELADLKDRLERDIEMYTINANNVLDRIVEKLALNTVELLDARINNITSTINRLESDKAVIEHTNRKIEEENKRIVIIDKLIAGLSPDGGLIAESLSNFMHVFITDMNNIIEGIWKYELKVLPCTIEDGDLDYVFKVKIPNSVVGDVRELSTGQKEIVDFAFKITTFNYLGILNQPIFLDEVFVNLDPKHKELAFSYIDELLNTNTIGQVFTVSHRDESHASIDENTIFLDDSNASPRLKIKK